MAPWRHGIVYGGDRSSSWTGHLPGSVGDCVVVVARRLALTQGSWQRATPPKLGCLLIKSAREREIYNSEARVRLQECSLKDEWVHVAVVSSKIQSPAGLASGLQSV